MPRHLIGDAHEWINEIPTVPTHSLAKLQPSEQSWEYLCVLVSHGFLKEKGKKTIVVVFLLSVSVSACLFVVCLSFSSTQQQQQLIITDDRQTDR